LEFRGREEQAPFNFPFPTLTTMGKLPVYSMHKPFKIKK
jgi:hypothetical protein